MSEMLDYALQYVASDWSIFPVCSPSPTTEFCYEGHSPGVKCSGPGKTPLIKWKVAQQFRANEEQAERWWRMWPNANIGLATGKLSNVCVIDIDGAEAMLEALKRGLPQGGPSATTGREGGRHVYCQYREDAPTIFAKASGIDFRGEGGFVVLPPSHHKSGTQYAWALDPWQAPLPPLPAWVNEMAETKRDGEQHGHIDVGSLFLEGIPEGERDTTLFRVAAKLRAVDVPEDVALGVLLALAARCNPPFDPRDTQLKVESAYRRYKPAASRFEPAEAREGYFVSKEVIQQIQEHPIVLPRHDHDWRMAGSIVDALEV